MTSERGFGFGFAILSLSPALAPFSGDELDAGLTAPLQDGSGGAGVDRGSPTVANWNESSRSLGGHNQFAVASAIQTETAPLPSINFAPRRASTIVAQGGLLTGTPRGSGDKVKCRHFGVSYTLH
jgi:hypothetical protein